MGTTQGYLLSPLLLNIVVEGSPDQCYKERKKKEDPRWQQRRWKLHSPPPQIELELQLKCRAINQKKQPKTS